jgi:hypothetical protein
VRSDRKTDNIFADTHKNIRHCHHKIIFGKKINRGGILGNIAADKKDEHTIIQLTNKIKSVLNTNLIYDFLLTIAPQPLVGQGLLFIDDS